MKRGKHFLLILLFIAIFFGFSNFPTAYANQSPSGWLDGATCDIIGGWAYDQVRFVSGVFLKYFLLLIF